LQIAPIDKLRATHISDILPIHRLTITSYRTKVGHDDVIRSADVTSRSYQWFMWV